MYICIYIYTFIYIYICTLCQRQNLSYLIDVRKEEKEFILLLPLETHLKKEHQID